MKLVLDRIVIKFGLTHLLLRRGLFIFISFIISFPVFNSQALAPDSPNWRWSYPQPHGNNIFDVIPFGDVLVQLCDSGRLYFSSDGISWEFAETGSDNNLRSATVFKESLLIGTADGQILKTQDLEVFEIVDLNTTDWVEGIAASAFISVAVGDNGKIWTSQDGTNWTEFTQFTQEWLRGVHYTGSRFIAVGENGTILSSLSGLNWTSLSSPTTENLNRLDSLANTFKIVGDNGVILSSQNGIQWVIENSPTSEDLFCVSLGENFNVIGGRSIAISQTNNSEWSIIESDLPSWVWLSSILWNDSIHLFGRTGLSFSISFDELNNPTTWTTSDTSIRNWIWDLQVVGDEFLAVGDLGTILNSRAGIRWESVEVPSTVTNNFFLGLKGTDSSTVAVGTGGAILHSTPIISDVVSTNTVDGETILSTNQITIRGRQWQDVSVPGIESDLQGVEYFNDGYIVSGENGLFLTSPNGTEWTSYQSNTGFFISSLAASESRLVGVGENGTVGYTDDGIQWVFPQAPTDNWLVRVRYIEDSYFAVGENGSILNSQDGVSWIMLNTPQTSSWINDIHFLNGVYYAVGTLGTVWYSTDLSSWNDVSLITGKSLYSMASLRRRLIVAGVEGIILRTLSEDLTDPIVLQDPSYLDTEDQNLLGLTLVGTTDQFFLIERSTNLVDWSTVLQDEITDFDGLYVFLWEVLSNATENLGIEFFRATLLPSSSAQ